MRNSFIFYRSFKNAVQKLPVELQLEMLYSIIDYALDEQQPAADGNGIISAIFELVRPTIDRDSNRYSTNIENGKKGGAPKGNQNAKKQPKTTENNRKQAKNNRKTTLYDDEDDDEDVYDDEDDDVVGCFSSSSSMGFELLAHSEPTSRILSDCDCELTEQDAQAVIKAFEESEWLRLNITSLKWITAHLEQVMSGYYRTYKQPPTALQGVAYDGAQTVTGVYDCITVITDDDE